MPIKIPCSKAIRQPVEALVAGGGLGDLVTELIATGRDLAPSEDDPPTGGSGQESLTPTVKHADKLMWNALGYHEDGYRDEANSRPRSDLSPAWSGLEGATLLRALLQLGLRARMEVVGRPSVVDPWATEARAFTAGVNNQSPFVRLRLVQGGVPFLAWTFRSFDEPRRWVVWQTLDSVRWIPRALADVIIVKAAVENGVILEVETAR